MKNDTNAIAVQLIHFFPSSQKQYGDYKEADKSLGTFLMGEGVKAIDLVNFGAMPTHATFFKKGDSCDFLTEFEDDSLEAVVTLHLNMDQDKTRLLKKTLILDPQAVHKPRDIHTYTRESENLT